MYGYVCVYEREREKERRERVRDSKCERGETFSHIFVVFVLVLKKGLEEPIAFFESA